MKSRQRNILDIRRRKKEPRSRARARVHMTSLLLERPPRLRERRRRQRIIAFCICMIGGIGLVAGIGGASHLEKFAIKDVLVEGVKELSAEVLARAVRDGLADKEFQLFSHKNMFLYPKSAIEAALAGNYPRIHNVTITRPSLLAQAITVTVREREPFALWCASDNQCFVMDEHGFIYADAGDAPHNPYVFRGGLLPNTDVVGQTFLRGRMQTTETLLRSLQDAGFKPQGIIVDSEKDFSIPLENGPRLLVAFDMTNENVLRNLETALEAESLKQRFEQLQYIDLRFGNRVYYK